MDVITELLKNDVLVVATGCGAIAAGKYGYLRGEAGLDKVGPGLREICETIGIPPVLHLGSCVDNSRILTVLSQMATEGGLGDDISDIPAVGLAPEWMSEKALAIATYCAASGAYVIMGVRNPVEFSDLVTDIMTEEWEQRFGGKLEFVTEAAEIVRKTLEHIDKKRAALKLPAYDPTRHGASGDQPIEAVPHRAGRAADGPVVRLIGGTTMSRYIATRAIRGANLITREAEDLLNKAIAEKGPDCAGRLPEHCLLSADDLRDDRPRGHEAGRAEAGARAREGPASPDPDRELLDPLPWRDARLRYVHAALAEIIEAVRFVYGEEPARIPGFHMAGGSFTSPDGAGAGGNGYLNGPIDDVQLRAWGIQLVDGRMPGFAAIVGCAKSNEVAVKIVRELQKRNILIFLCGNVNGRSIIHQLQEEGVEMGYDTYIVPFGLDTLLRDLPHWLRHPFRADVRRHEGRPGEGHPALQPVSACSHLCWRWARSTT
jgi:hypothetical protein